MRKLLIIIPLCAFILISSAQNPIENQYKNLGILEIELEQAKTPDQKTNALISLYIYHSAHPEPFNKIAAKEYQQQLEIYTHHTNDPELIARALNTSTFFLSGDELKKRTKHLYEYAKMHQLDFYQARAKIREAAYFFNQHSDLNKTNQLINEALNLSKDINDSLRTIILLQVGSRYNSMNNHLQALQFAFQAHELSTKIRSSDLIYTSNILFEEIYRNLENYEKALDYSMRVLQQLKVLNKYHLVAFKHANVAGYFFRLDQPVLGNYHIKEAYRLADSIKGSKRLYNEITGYIIATLTFTEHNEILTDFLKKYRQHFFILPGHEFLDNVILARAFAKTGNMDSARRLINVATGILSNNERADIRKRYYYTLAIIASYDMNLNAAVENYKKSLQLTLGLNNITEGIQYTDSLNNILVKQNQFAEAVHYYRIGDSLQRELSIQLDKEDITRQEVAALEKQKELEAIEKENEKNQRYNLQYLGITFCVVALFIALLLMGIFKVSPRTIKILSFFSFLLFFEFIFLIFKKQISVVTHGEPWKDLLFMVLLAAVMVPLHHWGEHKVVEYLSTKKIAFRKTKFFKKKVVSK